MPQTMPPGKPNHCSIRTRSSLQGVHPSNLESRHDLAPLTAPAARRYAGSVDARRSGDHRHGKIRWDFNLEDSPMDPRYPIGKFEMPAHVTPQRRDEAIAETLQIPKNPRAAVAGPNDAHLDTT